MQWHVSGENKRDSRTIFNWHQLDTSRDLKMMNITKFKGNTAVLWHTAPLFSRKLDTPERWQRLLLPWKHICDYRVSNLSHIRCASWRAIWVLWKKRDSGSNSHQETAAQQLCPPVFGCDMGWETHTHIGGQYFTRQVWIYMPAAYMHIHRVSWSLLCHKS